MSTSEAAADGAARASSAILWTLSALFALRVGGQLLQRWAPLAFLPPFEAFQGSRLPYWLLLPSQLVILAIMARISWRVATRSLAKNPRIGKILAWLGGLYMAGSLARLGIGLATPGAPHWFTSWISGVFHLVLAGFVLTLAAFHLQRDAATHVGRAQ